MSVKTLGLALKMTFEGNNQMREIETWVMIGFVIFCVLTQMNYLNKALDTFNTAIVTPIYYVCFTTLTLTASSIMFKDYLGQGYAEVLSQMIGFVVIVSGVARSSVGDGRSSRSLIIASSSSSYTCCQLRECRLSSFHHGIRGGGVSAIAAGKAASTRRDQLHKRLRGETVYVRPPHRPEHCAERL